MGFLDTILVLSPKERDYQVKKYIGQGNNGIEKREFFFRKRCAYISYYVEFINALNSNGIKYYIKGSSAWFANAREFLFSGYPGDINKADCDSMMNFLHKNYKENIPLIASFLPQNWDICIFSDQPGIAREEIYGYLQDLARRMEKDPNIIPQKRKTRSKKTDESSILSIKTNTNNDGADTFNGGWISICSEEYKHGHKFKDFDDKIVCTEPAETGRIGFLIFWVAIYHIPVHHVHNFSHNFLNKLTVNLPSTLTDKEQKLNAVFLNPLGLLLNTLYMKAGGVDRKIDKKLDIDNLRMGSMGINKYEAYKQIHNIWINTFSEWTEKDIDILFGPIPYNSIENEIKKNILNNYITPEGISYLETIENSLVTEYRPTINNILIHMNYKLSQTKFEGVESVKLFIVGGDAFARYITTDKISDIDVKLIITPHKKQGGKRPVIPSYIREEIVRFVTETISEYIVYLNYTGKFFDKPLFRLRNYDATKQDFPYNLISMDCRGNHDFPQADVYGFFLDYAILDISIMYNNNKKSTEDYVWEIPCRGELRLPGYLVSDAPKSEQVVKVLHDLSDSSKLPIASVPFLVKEMVDRYENPDSVEGRFFAGKIEKDIQRYLSLKTQNVKLNDTYNIMDPFLFWTMNLVDRINLGLSYFGCIYSSQFNFIRSYKKGSKLQVPAPDRFHLETKTFVNRKSKTPFSSEKFSFCDNEYLKQIDMDDIHYFMGHCRLGFDNDYSWENTKKYMGVFCNIMNRADRTEYPLLLGEIVKLNDVEKYLGIY